MHPDPSPTRPALTTLIGLAMLCLLVPVFRFAVAPEDVAPAAPHAARATRIDHEPRTAKPTPTRRSLPRDPLLVPDQPAAATAPAGSHLPESCCASFELDRCPPVVAALAVGDFPRAAAALDTLPADDLKRRLQLHVAGLWAARDPATAARFAESLPAGGLRWTALTNVIQQWREHDVAAASRWLNALDPTPDHDGAVAAIASHPLLKQRHPEVALSWAESITVDALRWDTLRSVIIRWAASNEPAARHYARTSLVLTPEQREHLLAFIARPRATGE